MNIYAFVGSRRGKLSSTYQVISRLISEIDKNIEIKKVQIDTADSMNFHSCLGCCSCFSGGSCNLDKKDGMSTTKTAIMESDIVILGTPVYAATVSGDTKIFIDRLSSWLHLMPLIGKVGVNVVSASNNHLFETSSYQKRMMETMGLSVVRDILVTTDIPPMLSEPDFFDHVLPDHARIITEYLDKKRKLIFSDYQQRYFQNYRTKLLTQGDISNSEYMFWEKNSYFAVDSIADLVQDTGCC